MLTIRHTRHAGLRPGLPRAIRWLSIPWLLGSLSAFGCGSDADLPKQYLGDSSDSSETTGAGLEPSDGGDPATEDGWWCLGKAPQVLPQPRRGDVVVGFVLPVVEWISVTPLVNRGLVATLCPSALFNCESPLAPPFAIRDGLLANTALPAGAAGIPVPEGFDGFIKLDVIDVVAQSFISADQVFIPASYYLPGPISGDISLGHAVLMLQRGSRNTLFQQSFPSLDFNTALSSGTVISAVSDCQGQLVSDVRVEITVAGRAVPGMTRFVLPNSRIPIEVPPDEPLVTGASGMVGFIGVPPGAVQLRAFRRDEAQPFGTTELGAVSGEISVGSLRPAYLRGANLGGSMPLAPRPSP